MSEGVGEKKKGGVDSESTIWLSGAIIGRNDLVLTKHKTQSKWKRKALEYYILFPDAFQELFSSP